MNVPAHYSPVMPYFVVPDGEAFIEFLKSVFDAEEKLAVCNDAGSLIHAEYSINGGTVMFGQAGGDWRAYTCGVFVVTDKVDELYERGINSGGTSNQEPGDYGYGRAAGFLDKWGNQWWLNEPAHYPA